MKRFISVILVLCLGLSLLSISFAMDVGEDDLEDSEGLEDEIVYTNQVTGDSIIFESATDKQGVIVIEANEGKLSSNVVIVNEEKIDGKKHIVLKHEKNLLFAPDKSASADAEYNFKLSEKGKYFAWISVYSPNNKSDSSWISVDGGKYNVFYSMPSTRWRWVRINLGTMDEGLHNIRLKVRESGHMIGRIVINNTSKYDPEDSFNINEEDSEAEITYLRGRDAYKELYVMEIPQQQPGFFMVEAEDMTITAPMIIQDDKEDASGGKYIVTPLGTKKLDVPASRREVHARAKFEVTEKGRYTFWFRGQSPTGNSDTSWFSVDFESYVQTPVSASPRWNWSRPLNAYLDVGLHSFNIKYREAGQMIDKIIITNDASFTPKGLGALPGEEENQVEDPALKQIIKVRVNGTKIEFDTNPITDNGVILVPVKSTLVSMGIPAELVGENITATKDRSYIVLNSGERYANFNNTKLDLKKPAQMVEISLLANIEPIVKAFGAKYSYDPEENWIDITVEEEELPRKANQGEIILRPFKKNLSYSIPYHTDENVKCEVWTRRTNSLQWKKSYDPVYRDGAFNGSFTRLTASKSYHIKVRIVDDGKLDTFYDEYKTRTDRDLSRREFMHTTDELLLIPTFENMSYYLDVKSPNSSAQVRFREVGGKWEDAFTPYFDVGELQVRGSIVNLKPDTEYEVNIKVYENKKLAFEDIKTVRTWTDTPPIAQEIDIKDIYKGGVLNLESFKGSADGYIKIKGDGETVIDGGSLNDEAIYLANSEYLILENLIVRGGRFNSITVSNYSHDIRIINCDISAWGRPGIHDLTVGIYRDFDGSKINNDSGIKIDDVHNIVVERCYVHDPNGHTNAWSGPTWSNVHPEGPNAINIRGLGGIVIRYNDFIGSDKHRWNDAIESFYNEDITGGPGRDCDIYGNILAYGQDDGIEFDGGQMNVRFYRNKIEGFLCGISTAPNRMGPSYVWENIITNMGDEINKVGSAVKNGGGTTFTYGHTYYFNNTFDTNAKGINAVGYRSDEDRARFKAYTSNNILVINRSVADAPGIRDPFFQEDNFFDYDLFGNKNGAGGAGMHVIAEGQEKNAVYGLPTYVNQDAADFRLAPGSLGIDVGTVIPNFKSQYMGNAPDMGALGDENMDFIPYRPIDIVSDKYQINLSKSEATGYVTFNIGDMPEGQGYSLRKNEAFDWLEVTLNDDSGNTKGSLTPNSALVIKVTVDVQKIELARGKGAFILRLDNGYSIPVMVYADK